MLEFRQSRLAENSRGAILTLRNISSSSGLPQVVSSGNRVDPTTREAGTAATARTSVATDIIYPSGNIQFKSKQTPSPVNRFREVLSVPPVFSIATVCIIRGISIQPVRFHETADHLVIENHDEVLTQCQSPDTWSLSCIPFTRSLRWSSSFRLRFRE